MLDADFTDATMVSSNLHRANLAQADFTGADLRYATMTRVNLKGATLARANVGNADLRDSTHDEVTAVTGAIKNPATRGVWW